MPPRQEALIPESHKEGQGPPLGEEAKSRAGDMEEHDLELPVLDFCMYVGIFSASACVFLDVGVDAVGVGTGWTQRHRYRRMWIWVDVGVNTDPHLQT